MRSGPDRKFYFAIKGLTICSATEAKQRMDCSYKIFYRNNSWNTSPAETQFNSSACILATHNICECSLSLLTVHNRSVNTA